MHLANGGGCLGGPGGKAGKPAFAALIEGEHTRVILDTGMGPQLAVQHEL
jgi:metal-dependent hydrolase (beta-lactamase superfamily II)